jgi:hypothetical protein
MITHLEIIVGAGVIAVAVMTTVATLVGALTYLVTKERAHPTPVAQTTCSRASAAPDRQGAEFPAAIAG